MTTLLRYFTDFPVVMLIISVIAAGILYFLVDHFRAYVLDGSRDPVRLTSLRYLQIFVGLFTLMLVGIVLALFGLLGWLNTGSSALSPAPTATQHAGDTSISTPSADQASGNGNNDQGETATATLPPPPTPTPSITAIVGNTGGAGANMRTIPGMAGTIITSVNDGTQVTLLGEVETVDGFTWQMIALPDGRQGWVVTNFLIYEP
jgi:hypothetical protein